MDKNFIKAQTQPLTSIKNLPPAIKSAFGREYIESDIGPVDFTCPIDAILPEQGNTLLISSKGNPSANLMFKAMHFVAKQGLYKKITYIDHASNPDSPKPFHILKKQLESSSSVSDLDKKNFIELLNNKTQLWKMLFAGIKSKINLKVHKLPISQLLPKRDEKQLVITVNPRKQSVRLIASMNCPALIIDTSANSFLEMGSRAHLTLNDSPQAAYAHRKLLATISKAAEVRVISMSDGSKIGLVRSVDVKHITSKLLNDDKKAGLGSVMLRIQKAMPTWGSIAARYSEQQGFSEADSAELVIKSSRLDVNSANEAKKIERKVMSSSYSQKIKMYSDLVVKDHLDEALEYYDKHYAAFEIDETPETFVRRHAEIEFMDNYESEDLVFNEVMEPVRPRIESRHESTSSMDM